MSRAGEAAGVLAGVNGAGRGRRCDHVRRCAAACGCATGRGRPRTRDPGRGPARPVDPRCARRLGGPVGTWR